MRNPLIPLDLSPCSRTHPLAFDPILVASRSDESALAGLIAALRAWEPRLDLFVSNDDSTLFEPDGTLYAVCLSESNLRFRHRVGVVRMGDALIVPQGVAVEADPGLDYVGIRHEGIPPYHFRERFIQSRGFEHVEAPTGNSIRVEPIIPFRDARYRMSYARIAASGSSLDVLDVGLDAQLVVVYAGDGRVTCGDEPDGLELTSDSLALIPAGLSYQIEGNLVAICLRLEPELTYEARRMTESAAKGPAWSPEHDPAHFKRLLEE